MKPTEVAPEPVGNFAGADAPLYSDILNCMHCGLCLPTCPTYSITGRERSSPRGRIALMKGVADGLLEVSPTFADEMFFCLGCLACQTACPAGVPYGELLESARTQVAAHPPSAAAQFSGFVQRLAFRALEHPPLLQFGAQVLHFYQASGLRGWLQRTGLLDRLPERLRELERLMPAIPAKPGRATIAELTPARGEQLARVGILLGCVMDVFCSPDNEATARVLARNGCQVVAPRAARCCGALHAHAGFMTPARRLAKQVIEAFEQAEVDAVVLNSAGCGAAMKDYGHWLADDPAWAERAAAFSAKVMDITEWLAVHGLAREGLRPLGRRVTYHDACHLFHAQKVGDPPRTVLGQVPGLDYVELPESNWCCGSAGTYNVTHPDAANQLLDRKMANLRATGAEIVVTGNPGCLMQLQYGIRRHGLAVEAIHTAELLDRAYGGSDG